MRHVKRYQELFESQIELSQEQIEWLNECTDGTWTLNPQTGLVDVSGNFNCSGRNLVDFKGVRFGAVTGDFNCSLNQLTSLEGAPQEVGGNFNCGHNYLTSLVGAPQEVGGSFNCSLNQLTSLEGAPQEVKGDFICSGNKLTSLEGAPQKIEGDFSCYANTVSESVLKSLYRKMQSGMSWDEAVEMQWDYIDNENDQILLAPSNPKFSPDEKKGYEVLAKLRKRVI